MIELGTERTFKKENLIPYKTHISLSLPQMVPRVMIFFLSECLFIRVFQDYLFREARWVPPKLVEPRGRGGPGSHVLPGRASGLVGATLSSDIHLPVALRNALRSPCGS